MTSVQLRHWRGPFGNEYIERNAPEDDERLAAFWRGIVIGYGIQSAFEVGANIGRNLRAIQSGPGVEVYGLEPNDCARQRLVSDGVVKPANIVGGVAEKIEAPNGLADLVFTSGVLIHIAPANLLQACSEIYRVSKRYIACAEYYADEPEQKTYRGEDGLLFKRDYGAFWLDNFPLRVMDYGFWWKRAGDGDNMNWWLFEKPH